MGSQNRRSRMSVEEVKLKIMGEVTGMLGVIVLNLGMETGVWRAMRGGSNLTPKQVAVKAGGLSERYLEELLRAAALHGYIGFTPGEGVATKEWDRGMEEVLFDEVSPNYYGHSMAFPMHMVGQPYEKLIQSFKDDSGVPYSLYGTKFAEFIEKSHSKIYQTQIKEWLKHEQLKDVRAILTEGGVALDLGCGTGLSSISLAQEFPKTTVHAVDLDEVSIKKAKVN